MNFRTLWEAIVADVQKDSFNIFITTSASTRTSAIRPRAGTTLASTPLAVTNVAARMVTSSTVICKFAFR